MCLLSRILFLLYLWKIAPLDIYHRLDFLEPKTRSHFGGSEIIGLLKF